MVSVERIRSYGKRMGIQFKGIRKPEAVSLLRGSFLMVPPEAVHPLPEDTFYVFEIVGLQVETEVRAGRGGKLFGSVTNIDVSKLLAEKDFDIDRRRIELSEPIKAIGDFEAIVRVGQDIRATIKIHVKPIGGELEDVSVDGEDELPPAPVAMMEDDEAPRATEEVGSPEDESTHEPKDEPQNESKES